MTETSGYPDYAAPNPNGVTVEDIVPGQLEYEAQGGQNFKFWNKVSDTFYSQANVYQYEQLRRSFDMKVRQIQEFEESLKGALSDGNIDTEIAEDFAQIFDISLKREFEFTVTVEFTFTAELDMESDPDSVVDNLTFSVSPSYYGDAEIDNDNYEVIDSNWTDV